MDLIPQQLPQITERCRQLGWITATTELTGLAPAGEGNMNRAMRVQLAPKAATEPRTFILKQAVPFVAKYPDIPAPIERGATEAAFYAAINADAVLALRMPSLLGFDPTEHLLCLEDLGPSADMTSIYAERNPRTISNDKRLAGLVAWLSRLHALPISQADFPNNAGMRRLNHEHIFLVPFDPESSVELPTALADLRLQLHADAHLGARIQHLGDIYRGNAVAQSRPALLHGDYYPGSWLSDEHMDCQIIDPEFAFVGPAEFDVGVMLAHLTFAGYSEEARMQLMTRYIPPPGFAQSLALQFCAIEILRRLLGVAQLPLKASVERRLEWATDACMQLRNAA
ncbi:MAG: phosphotransferase [Pseudomonadales bacterium]